MAQQPRLLTELVADPGPAHLAAQRLAGRRVWLCGTGTSWHAANHGAWFLHAAGVDAIAVQAADAAAGGARPQPGDGLILLSHTGAKRAAATVLARAQQDEDVACVVVGAQGRDGVDVPTVPRERSSAYTASHTGALLRLAQIAEALGARRGIEVTDIPDAIVAVLDAPPPDVALPERLLEFTGAAANQWTAAEGALKAREAARVATEGLSVEQLLHGPAVALTERDSLVCLDGGGAEVERLDEVAGLAHAAGTGVHRISQRELGEALSVFPLTVAVQRIALDSARALGTDPDAFGYEVPGRPEAWERVAL